MYIEFTKRLPAAQVSLYSLAAFSAAGTSQAFDANFSESSVATGMCCAGRLCLQSSANPFRVHARLFEAQTTLCFY